MRERLLQAAMDMLASDGVAEFTTRRLAQHAGTSTPAVYELFGDKAGLDREVFFESFRLLRQYLDEVRPSQDPRGELISVIESLRMFAREHPVLTDLMFPGRSRTSIPGLRSGGPGTRCGCSSWPRYAGACMRAFSRETKSTSHT